MSDSKKASCFVFLLCLTLVTFIACTPSTSEPEVQEVTRLARTATATTSSYPAPSAQNVESGYPGPTVTPAAVRPTIGPSPTFTPSATPILDPTAMPTPEVTPIPTVVEIPGLLPSQLEEGSFWIYGWRDNEVWRMDSRNREEIVLLDTLEMLGQPLADNVPLPHQEFLIGPVIAPDPTGNRIATVTAVVEADGSRDEHFTFVISIVNLDTGQITTIGEGTFPTWSPDGQQIAFIRSGGLWVASLDTGESRQIVSDPERGRVFDINWSPDNEQIAFMYLRGNYQVPTIWLVNVNDGSEPQELLTHPSLVYQLKFAPDGQHLYFVADTSVPHVYTISLFSVSLATREVRQFTENMFISSYFISPDGHWLFFDSFHIHEPSAGSPAYDLWLKKVTDKELYRLTFYQDIDAIGWDSTGSQVLAMSADSPNQILLISLVDLNVDRITIDTDSKFMIVSESVK